MDEQVKVCPECGAEFFAHIMECNRCEAELVSPETVGRPSKMQSPSADPSLVCIDEGSYDRSNEVAWGLRSAGFDAKVLRTPANSCKGGFGVFVDRECAREAAQKIEELWKQSHPEIEEAEERMRKGLCPACSALLLGSSEECPDCGLFVGVREDDCSGDGGCGSSGCGH